MSRIVIFGNSGSGKSTLAAALARTARLDHLDLDTLAWERDTPTRRRPLEASVADLDVFIRSRGAWVIEGCYSDLIASVLPHCTKLIFLNPGVECCIRNCRNRPWEPHKYPSPEAQDENLDMLMGWIREYETRADEFSLRSHRRLFDAFRGDKVEITEGQYMLKDLLRSHLDLVICGTAAGTKSAQIGHYYAGRGNKFWRMLAQTGLTREELAPASYQRLLEHGIGLTDLVKEQSGSDAGIRFDQLHNDQLRKTISQYQPRYFCFNGKRGARQFFSTRTIRYGMQADRIGETVLFVAPSTSGAANRWWDLAVWQDLADRVRGGSPRPSGSRSH